MKKTYAEIVICVTILALLAVPAVVSAQDKLSNVGYQLTPNRLMSSGGPAGGAELKHTAASTEVLASVYIDRAVFDADFPGLPIEDWEDFTDGSVVGCDAPANNGTSCPGGYNAGDILPGLELDCAVNTGPGGNGLVIIPTGFDGNDSIEFGSNTFTDNTIIRLDPPVDAVGFDIACHFGSPQVDILVFDGAGAQIWAGNYSPCDPTGAFVGWSADVPEGIGRIELNDPSGVSVEHIDDVAFGDAAAVLTFHPNRAGFNAANPGLPIEDFQDFTDVLQGCDAPANSGTSCPGGYDVGDILHGLEIDCAVNTGPGGNGLVIVPTGFDGNDSIEFGSNTFTDNTIINLDPPVNAIGFDIACHFGSPVVDIAVFDGVGGLIWAGNHTPCDPTGFFLGWDTTAPEGIGRIELNDPSGASIETLDDVAFPSSGAGLIFADGFESGNTTAWSSTTPP